jgi:hypothetical protein
VRKTLDQRASHELREKLAREQADEWAAILRSDAGKRATEAWVREHPEISDRSVPRFIAGMAFTAFVKRFIRNVTAERET